ncbi:MAG: Rieske 2Fe-2S domain-containing protein [Pseudomonadales bacterium]|nr:Rieske 2Fe-2S domain-containing protein [Pseudomonadales bacterium]
MLAQTETIRIIEGLLTHLDNDTNVDAGVQLKNPVSAYTSRDIAAHEWQQFFQDYPHLLGLSPDLPGPGSFMTSTELGKPILATRDQDGQFHAFLNVCRHRGTVVENQERGQKQTFHCPFHAWGYNTQGELIAVPKEDHFGAVDRSCNGLVELPAEERWGILWVHPNPNGVLNLDAQLGDLGAELGCWDLEEQTYQSTTTFPHEMNWKLAIDTFGETYHFNALHRNTLAQDFYGNAQMYDRYERNHRMMLCLKNIDTLREVDKVDWNVLLGALPVYYIFPNVQLIIGRAGPTLVRVYPDKDNPNSSFSKVSFYLDETQMELLQSSLDGDLTDAQVRMQGFANVIRDEDYVAAASSHVGAMSGAQEHIIFGRNEPALHHYHNTYREALGMEPLEVAD